MKILRPSVIIFACLLTVIILFSTVCCEYLPLWALITIIAICTLSMVIIAAIERTNRQELIDKFFSDINTKIDNAVSQIEQSSVEHEHNIINFISKANSEVGNLLTNLDNQEVQRSHKIEDMLTNSFESVQGGLNKIYNGVERLQKQGENNHGSISKELNEVYEKEKAIEDAITSSCRIVEAKTKELNEAIINNSVELKNELGQNLTARTDILQNLFSEATQNQATGFYTIQTIINDVGDRLHHAGKEQETNITNSLTNSKTGLEHQLLQMAKSGDEATAQFKECLKQSVVSFESNSEQISQKLSSFEESNKNRADSILEKIDALSIQERDIQSEICASFEGKADIITNSIAHLEESGEKHSESIIERIEALSIQEKDIKSDICSKIEILEEKTIELQNSIQNAVQETVEKVNAEFSESASTINNKVAETMPFISSEIDSVRTKFSELKEELLQHDSEHNDNLNIKFSDLSNTTAVIIEKLDSVLKQNTALANSINEDNDEYDKAAEAFIDGLRNQYSHLGTKISTLITKTDSIKKEIAEYSSNINNTEVVKSIQSAIIEFSGKLNSAVIDINKTVIESQQLQSDLTKDEILKLQILLRTLLNNITQEGLPGKSSKQPETGVKDPNRTESIFDEETKNTVLNQYKNNILVKSIMKNKLGTVIYELEYHDGKISHSKSFDESGELKIEQTYYDNGQVHFREEYRKDGKHSSEF